MLNIQKNRALQSLRTWEREHAAIEVNLLIRVVLPISDDKFILKQDLPKISVSILLADDHDSLTPQNVSNALNEKKMQFLGKQRSMILNDFVTEIITSLSLIMAQSTMCITYSVRFLSLRRLRIGFDMLEVHVIKGFHQTISLNNFHDMESSIESWRFCTGSL